MPDEPRTPIERVTPAPAVSRRSLLKGSVAAGAAVDHPVVPERGAFPVHRCGKNFSDGCV